MTDSVRAAYTALADRYADLTRRQVLDDPFGRAVFDAFAAGVRGAVLDAGCGPGRMTAYLRELGVPVSGIDLTPELIDIARSDHPGVPFAVGDLRNLPHADGALGGVVAWYSFIHLDPAQLPVAFAEFARVLAPGGRLLLGFFAGAGEVFDHKVIEAHRWSPDRLGELLATAGFAVRASLTRAPYPGERFRQGALLAQRIGHDVSGGRDGVSDPGA